MKAFRRTRDAPPEAAPFAYDPAGAFGLGTRLAEQGDVEGARSAFQQAIARHGLTPKARVAHLSARGDDPVLMLTAPIPATAHALDKAGMSLDEIDLIEINEAFAPVVLAWQRETGADLARVNACGGAIALGHPLGATGARLLTTLLHALHERL